jgi:hypothetical protein
MLKSVDTNNDGALSQDDQRSGEFPLTEFDADKNGSLSLQEFEPLWAGSRRWRLHFQFLDPPNGDAAISGRSSTIPSATSSRPSIARETACSPADRMASGGHRGRHHGWRDWRPDDDGPQDGAMRMAGRRPTST